VRSNRQILVCPDCQAGSDWTADLDRCRTCGSVRLVRRLGEVECRDCGRVESPEQHLEAAAAGTGQPPDLAEDVARALERMFGRSAPKPPASAALP
jgi:ribosomal protein L40E